MPSAEVGLHAINTAVKFVCGSFPLQLVAALGPRVQAIEYTIVSTNKAAVQAIENTRRVRPYQAILRIIAEESNALQTRGGPQIKIQWVPKEDLTFDAPKEAIQLAKNATARGLRPMEEISPIIARRRACQLIKKSTQKLNNHLDTALPGKHTKEMYDQLTGKQAAILCQLRTGMNRLNNYLSKIRVRNSAQCECDDHEVETSEHYLFECSRWQVYRDELKGSEGDRWKDLSYFVGGRSERTAPNGELIDGERKHWAPNVEVVKRTIDYAMKTGRLQ